MMLPMLLLLAAAPERFPAIEETIVVPPRDWRAIDFSLRQRPAVVECDFRVVHGKAAVRLMLIPRDDLERLESGQRHHVLAVTGFEHSGRLRFQPPALGDYALVVDNRGEDRAGAEVRVAVWFDFAAGTAAPVRTLSPHRRFTVVLVTLLIFGAIVTWAGRRLHRSVRSRV